jgi:methyl-accepting chemotaxis protein
MTAARITMKNDTGIARRLSFNRIDNETVAALREARPFVAEVMPGILDRFYDHLGRYEETMAFFGTRAVAAHAKEMQLKHWQIIMEGRFDETYEKSVTRIGEVHNRLGLEPRWYIGGYNSLISDLVEAIALRLRHARFDRDAPRKRARLQKAIINAALLDMDLAISVYIEAGRRERHATLAGLAKDFEAAVGGVVNTVAAAATKMQSSAESLRSATDHTSVQSGAAAKASQEAISNVTAVASAAEELNSSIAEISRRVSESAGIAAKAAQGADAAALSINRLSEAGQKIGAIVDLITSIASQTNLLALNATIEAARAGEAGRGFAVVASEVKGLAEQTAKATAEIATQIGGIQQSTSDSVTTISGVTEIIKSMSEVSTAIASAVEEQNAATGEISRSAQLASTGTTDVSANIVEVARAAQAAGETASGVLTAAAELSDQSELLRREVSKFLDTVRAA